MLLLPGCEGIPKDPDGTLDRIKAERRYRVGLIAPGTDAGKQRLFLHRVSAAANAQPLLEHGASEPLLTKLEEGKLDLVIGELAPNSPWAKRVTILPPLGERVSKEGHVHIVGVAKNGENGWIGLLHREAEAVAAQP
ncbi:MAG TPA: hypothetical protein VNT77_00030 [Allosphingosinicella sp.]|nr:hypothetical protein [Allosphingosinicella sp.]